MEHAPNHAPGLRFLSVCSGIDAASVAWEPLGWQPVGFSEIEKFPSAVLAHRWPDVPNLGDLTNHGQWPNILRPDLIVGGTPCQAFSVAGLRKGLADPRGNLTLVFLGLLEQFRPRWVVWENVPGVLSDKTGAFGSLLGGLGKLGYGFAYRVLDAQHFGVPQRRRRVFVVGCLGDWKRAAAVLFEPESLRGDPPPRREPGKAVTRSLRARANSSHREDSDNFVPVTANPLTARMHKGVNSTMDEGQTMVVTHSLRGEGFDASEDGTGRGREGGAMPEIDPDGLACQRAASGGSSRSYIADSGVRRLTLTECERLQGFPDGHTLIPWRGKPPESCPDGPRYKALGNSMAVPVMAWIGRRLDSLR